MPFQVLAVLDDQREPAVFRRDGGLRVAVLHALVVHLEEEQVRDLLHVIAIRDALVAQDVGVVPDFGYKGCFLAHNFPVNASLRID